MVIESHSGDVELRLPPKAPARLQLDAARIVGAPGKPEPAGGGKRSGPRTIALNSPDATAASVTVRTFKGEVRIVPANPTPRAP